MVSCNECQRKSQTTCSCCMSLIDGVVLQQRLKNPRPVTLIGADGETVTGKMFVVSPVGLGIEARITRSGYFILKVDDKVLINVRKIQNRGKNDCHGFDIVEVLRPGETSTRLNAEEYEFLTNYNCHVEPANSRTDNVVSIETERKNRDTKTIELLKTEIVMYRNAVQAVTGGKLLLVNSREVSVYLPDGAPLIDTSVKDYSDIENIKNTLKEYLTGKTPMSNKIIAYVLCISEALDNVLKHTVGGNCRVSATSTGLSAVITDNGKGIDFSLLPKNQKQENFSSLSLLGPGFSNMLKFLDRLVMSTSNEGTVLIMEKANLF